MSKLIIAMIEGDAEKFRQSLIDREDDYRRIAEQSRSAGALHHRFGVGDGNILVVDEWDTEEHFSEFFGRPELQQFIGEVGGDTSVAPEIMITEAITSPDQF